MNLLFEFLGVDHGFEEAVVVDMVVVFVVDDTRLGPAVEELLSTVVFSVEVRTTVARTDVVLKVDGG